MMQNAHCQYYTNNSHHTPTLSLQGGSAPKQSVLNHKTSLKPNYVTPRTLPKPQLIDFELSNNLL